MNAGVRHDRKKRECCAQGGGLLGKVTRWPLYSIGGWVTYRGEGQPVVDPVLGSKPQIYASHKCDALLWVLSGLVLVAAPEI